MRAAVLQGPDLPLAVTEVDEPVLGGVLATVCPSDKKILHGMRDAMMLPCIAR